MEKAKIALVALITAYCSSGNFAKSPAALSEKGRICSFNIQFLGHFKNRQDDVLADILQEKDCLIVVVQELVAPPAQISFERFPNGEKIKTDPESTKFFAAMSQRDYSFLISEEDTGKSTNHANSTASEWWALFYKPDRFKFARDLPGGFISEKRVKNSKYDRVPYAFPLRSRRNYFDFVLISVHLRPDKSSWQFRKSELAEIGDWVNQKSSANPERDYIILGDMNIESGSELTRVIPDGWKSLNSTCLPTNTLPTGPKPYDHVMLRENFSSEIETASNFGVVSLVEETRKRRDNTGGVFPGDPYNHDQFRSRFSDHNPIYFDFQTSHDDD